MLLLSGTARAGDEQDADRLFEEGRVLMADGKLRAACAKFASSMSAAPSVGALVNLARCHEEQGKLATAANEYRRAATLAEQRGEPERANAARALASKLAPRLSRLTIRIEQPVAGLTLTRNGVAVPAGELGQPVAVDPGDFRIAARATGRQPWSATVTVGPDGDRQQVLVPALEPTPGSAASASHPTPVAGARPDRSPASEHGAPAGPPTEVSAEQGDFQWTGQHVAAIVIGGVGIAGLVLGGVFGGQASSQWDEALSHCTDADTSDCGPEAGPLSQDAASSATVSTVGFIAGGAAVAAGLVLWLTVPEAGRDGAESGWTLAPTCGSHHLGASLQGKF